MPRKKKSKKVEAASPELVAALELVNEIVKPADAMKDIENAGDEKVTQEINDLAEELTADDAAQMTEEVLATLEDVVEDGVEELRKAYDAVKKAEAEAKAKPTAKGKGKAKGKAKPKKEKKEKAPRKPNRVECMADACEDGMTREEIIEAADKLYAENGGSANFKEAKFVGRYIFTFLSRKGMMEVADDGKCTFVSAK
jgi:hypothetical protein